MGYVLEEIVGLCVYYSFVATIPNICAWLYRLFRYGLSIQITQSVNICVLTVHKGHVYIIFVLMMGN